MTNETRFRKNQPFKVEADEELFSFLGNSLRNRRVSASHRSNLGIYSYLSTFLAGRPWFESRQAHSKYDEVGVYLRKGIMRLTRRFFMSTIVISCLFSAIPAYCSANQIPSDLAIKAIMGEASNQGERGMLAVACAIRNRGHLKGVYGVKAKHIYKEPQWVWKQAKKAWEASANTDITYKATHWENVKAFGEPYWVKDMKHTVTIGDHSFYREVR